jgi:release factor glutamine methyltransferase
MQNLLETLKKSTDFLARKGLPQARREAEHLLAGGLGLKRLDLYLQFERLLTEAELVRLRDMVVRRGQREPLQHILGQVEFRDLLLKSDRRALIPRPETEELIDHAEKLFSAEAALRVLDLGTGTGAIALALASERPHWQVTAIDASPEALALAQENARTLGLSDRVQFSQSDWFTQVAGEFDLIVSNPPYLTDVEWTTAEPEVKQFDPLSALVAADAGLADLNKILQGALGHLRSGGWLICETGIAQHPELAVLSGSLGYTQSYGLNDMSGRPRFWLAQK